MMVVLLVVDLVYVQTDVLQYTTIAREVAENHLNPSAKCYAKTMDTSRASREGDWTGSVTKTNARLRASEEKRLIHSCLLWTSYITFIMILIFWRCGKVVTQLFIYKEYTTSFNLIQSSIVTFPFNEMTFITLYEFAVYETGGDICERGYCVWLLTKGYPAQCYFQAKFSPIGNIHYSITATS